MNSTEIRDSYIVSKNSIFEKLRVKPVVNGCGIYTDLGGSILSDEVWAHLTELNEHFVDLIALLDTTGQKIADLVNAEAARVTPGASAGIALATGAAMTGNVGSYWEQLPDTSGMRNEFILQRPQAAAYQYINPIRISGAKLVLAGSDTATTIDDIKAAITDQTAAIFIPAHLDRMDDVVRLESLGAFAKENGILFLVDAAYQIFPTERMQYLSSIGADLTMYSSKYFFGPNAGGFLAGTKEMIDNVAGLDFTRFESGKYRTFGRPFKMGRYEIAAVYLALEEWFRMNHEERLDGYAKMAIGMSDRLNRIDGLTAKTCCFTLDERIVDEPISSVLLTVSRPDLTASSVISSLQDGAPSIHVVAIDDQILIHTETLRPGDDDLIVDRIAEIF